MRDYDGSISRRACGSVLGRQGNPFGVPRTEVRGSLDRLRSLPHSAAMTDTSVRGCFAPAHFHAPESRPSPRSASVGLRDWPVDEQNCGLAIEFGCLAPDRWHRAGIAEPSCGGGRVGLGRRRLHKGLSITASHLRQRAEAVKADPNLFGSPAKRVASYVLCQAPRHATSSLRPIKVGEVSMR